MSPRSEPFRVLIVEDNDQKYLDIVQVFNACGELRVDVTRVRTEVEAEDLLSKAWDLLVLDISMGISPGAVGPLRGGFASLGGMDIVEAMYLREIAIPTVIITGFDYFQAVAARYDEAEMLNLKDIET